MPAEGEAGLAALVAGPGPAPAGRLRIHRNNVAAARVAALGAIFPAIRALVGEDFFRALALAFAAADPPRSPVLHDWGHGFAAFLAGFAPARPLPWLADVARLERAWLDAFHAADAPALPVTALGEVPDAALPGAVLLPHPACRLVASPHPVLSIWRDATGRGPCPVDLGRAETALVTRPACAVLVTPADGPPGLLAALVLDRAPLAEAARRIPAADLGEALARLFAAGAVAGIARA